MTKRDTFIISEQDRYKISDEVQGLLEEINRPIQDSSQKKTVSVFCCSGDGETLPRTMRVRRVSMTPSQFLNTNKVMTEVIRLKDSREEGLERDSAIHLEIYIVSEGFDNVFWSNGIPEFNVNGSIIIVSGNISGEFGGIFRDNLSIVGKIEIPSGEKGFSELSECIITIKAGNSNRDTASPFTKKIYEPLIRNSIKKYHDKMIATSSELLTVLQSKNKIKLTKDFNHNEMRVGDFFDAYLHITHFIANATIADTDNVYRALMCNFSIYKRIISFHNKVTPCFEKINSKIKKLVSEDRGVDDLSLLMEMSVGELLSKTNEHTNSFAFHATRIKSPLHNCLIPFSMMIKIDKISYGKIVGKLISDLAEFYPGRDVITENSNISGLIKIKEKDIGDSKEFNSMDPKFSHLGYVFEDLEDASIELLSKSEVHNTSVMITDFTLKPLRFKGGGGVIKIHSQLNIKRFVVMKFAQVLSPGFGIDANSNCKIELKVKVGEFLLRRLSPSTDYGVIISKPT